MSEKNWQITPVNGKQSHAALFDPNTRLKPIASVWVSHYRQKFYSVAEQMRELVMWKIPQNVWAEICVLFRVSILVSLVLALLLNTSNQFTLLRIICLVFYNSLEEEHLKKVKNLSRFLF